MTFPGSCRQDHPRPGSIGHLAACSWFWAWAVVGAIGMVGLVSLGPIALGPALLAGRAIAANPTARHSRSGVLAGVGLIFLLIAYIQRQGPGTTCWHTATAGGCDQHLDPIPWLIVWLVLLIGAILRQARHRD